MEKETWSNEAGWVKPLLLGEVKFGCISQESLGCAA